MEKPRKNGLVLFGALMDKFKLMNTPHRKKAKKVYEDRIRPSARAAWNSGRPDIDTRQRRRAAERAALKAAK